MKSEIPFRTAYDGKRNGSEDLDFTDDPGMTRQAHKDECDINVIMSQYEKSGLVAHVQQFEGEYGSYDEIDFHEAMNAVVAAEQMFLTVPSKIREKFDNDPGKFLAAVNDEEKGEETLRELGLLPSQKKAPEAPARSESLVVKDLTDSPAGAGREPAGRPAEPAPGGPASEASAGS